MLDYRKERLEMEPILFNDKAFDENLNALEFRRVVCKGVYDEKKSIYVGPRSRSISGVTENGYYLITPLLPIPGNPDCWKEKELASSHDVEEAKDLPSTSSSSGEKRSLWNFWSKKSQAIEVDPASSVNLVKVVGVVRGSEKPSIFVPGNDPTSGQWFYVDIPATAHASGLPQNTIYIEDINENVNPSNPYPVPKDATTLIRSSVMPQDHLNYMLTWYSLSAAVTFMAYKRLKPRKIRR
ncbi:Surfeit locus protein 1 [Bienertia sinuspersici]